MNIYDRNFYLEVEKESIQSAKHLVPLIIKLIGPKSVVDVGCATGVWLRSFDSNKVKNILGIDYIADLDTKNLRISVKNYIQHDIAKPIVIERKFDCAISLEVGEHISRKYAQVLVQSLVKLAPVVVFSAAIPKQTGEHHVNEQWPKYWSDKFAKHNYLCFDALRPLIWDNSKIEWWYRQNTLIFVSKQHYLNDHRLKQRLGQSTKHPLALIHPDNWKSLNARYEQVIKPENTTIRKIISQILSLKQ